MGIWPCKSTSTLLFFHLFYTTRQIKNSRANHTTLALVAATGRGDWRMATIRCLYQPKGMDLKSECFNTFWCRYVKLWDCLVFSACDSVKCFSFSTLLHKLHRLMETWPVSHIVVNCFMIWGFVITQKHTSTKRDKIRQEETIDYIDMLHSW